jgi:hypothetical protein
MITLAAPGSVGGHRLDLPVENVFTGPDVSRQQYRSRHSAVRGRQFGGVVGSLAVTGHQQRQAGRRFSQPVKCGLGVGAPLGHPGAEIAAAASAYPPLVVAQRRHVRIGQPARDSLGHSGLEHPVVAVAVQLA